jgi:peptidoglycan/xylan/chitin deacetylase (PgdA/CDA1 family)
MPKLPPYEWPAGKRCAFAFSADVDGESPWIWRHRGEQPGPISEIEQRRFGPRVGVYRLMDLLDEFRVKGTFYVPSWIAETYPHLVPEFAARGFEVGVHGHFHERVDEIDDDHNARVLDRSLATLTRQLGHAPRGYRSPSWELTPAVHRLLRERGFAYDSSLMSLDHPYSLDGLVEVPIQWLLDDAVYFRFTDHASRTPADPAQVLNSWIEEFEGIHEFGGAFVVTVHPWISGRGQRIRLLRKLFAHVQAKGDVWFTTIGEIADWHAGSANMTRFEMPMKLVSTETQL